MKLLRGLANPRGLKGPFIDSSLRPNMVVSGLPALRMTLFGFYTWGLMAHPGSSSNSCGNDSTRSRGGAQKRR